MSNDVAPVDRKRLVLRIEQPTADCLNEIAAVLNLSVNTIVEVAAEAFCAEWEKCKGQQLKEWPKLTLDLNAMAVRAVELDRQRRTRPQKENGEEDA